MQRQLLVTMRDSVMLWKSARPMVEESVTTPTESSQDSHRLMNAKLTFTIASVPDREVPVAELWSDDEMWGELTREAGRVRLDLYPRRSGEPWRFDYAEVEESLEEAKAALLGG